MDAVAFIKEYRRLCMTTPQISHWTRQSENCDYGDIIVVSRNSYLCFWSSNLENCFYVYESRKNRFCADCTFVEDCELCYQSIDCVKCYNGNFLQDCKQCTDCEHCYYCIGCNDCFGCAGLRRKKFCIFNEQYSEEEYARRLAEVKKWPTAKIQKNLEEIQLKTPRVFMHQVDNENSFGDYLHDCQWCINTWDANHCFGCIYVKNKEYLFLNQPISKSEYEKTTAGINKELAKHGIVDLYGLVNGC